MKIIKISLILIVIMPLLGCVVSSIASGDGLGTPTPRKEVSQVNAWSDVAKMSDLALVGHVEDIFYVVDEKKLYENKTVTNGLVPLPNLKESVKGTLIRFRIEEFVYSKDDEKSVKFVDIYIKDGYRLPTHSTIPNLLVGKKYFVFLSPLEKSDDFIGKTVIQPRDLARGSEQFDYKKAFVISEGQNGYVEITDSNQKVVTEMRRAIKKLSGN